MTPEELQKIMRQNMDKSMRSLVEQNTICLCDAYQRGWTDALELINTMAKEKGITLW